MDQGSNRKHSAVHNFAPTVTKFCVMWERQAFPHDTKFSNCRCEIVGRRVIFIWSWIPGSSWSGLIKAEPGLLPWNWGNQPLYIIYIWLLRNNHHKMSAITTYYHSEGSTITKDHDHIVTAMIILRYLEWNAGKFKNHLLWLKKCTW